MTLLKTKDICGMTAISFNCTIFQCCSTFIILTSSELVCFLFPSNVWNICSIKALFSLKLLILKGLNSWLLNVTYFLKGSLCQVTCARLSSSRHEATWCHKAPKRVDGVGRGWIKSGLPCLDKKKTLFRPANKINGFIFQWTLLTS